MNEPRHVYRGRREPVTFIYLHNGAEFARETVIHTIYCGKMAEYVRLWSGRKYLAPGERTVTLDSQSIPLLRGVGLVEQSAKP